MTESTAIWWIRRDLRLSDNQALQAALAHAAQIVPLFVLDPRLLRSPYVGEKRIAFLQEGLHQLHRKLQDRGSRLILRRGEPLSQLSAVISETGASAVFAEEDYSPYARTRDGRIRNKLPLHVVPGTTVHPPGTILKQDGKPYTVYTPFSKAWKQRLPPMKEDLLLAPARINVPDVLEGASLSSLTSAAQSLPVRAGEEFAQRRLQQFTAAANASIYDYAQLRNDPAAGGTSLLSPYLRFGMLSPRQAAVSALEAISAAPSNSARKSAETWLNELIWREFYVHILYHFPHVLGRNFRSKYDRIAWENDPQNFLAWQKGQTGYPLVDAAMRQLVESGWMHNRTRMITASFLTKDLLIDWRKGERFFMQHLIDGDPAANNGGWQWAAGTGTDAAPYFRIFNPVTQSKKFDPGGDYIRRWLPELANVPAEYIHEPWRMPDSLQEEIACRIGVHYPQPIVDHTWARDRTLAAYKSASA
jgi:deoxyribodipyrimidine photo-lyase